MMDGGEALEDCDESPVLPLCLGDIDDVVVEVVVAGGGSYGEELCARRVDQYLLYPADLRTDVNRHASR